jgi:pimeloyl-ACP methyl ester carboxylesterase
MTRITRLEHNRVSLALHHLRDPIGGGTERPLLMLHGLGESAPLRVPDWVAAWTGSIHALDFTGHGHSTLPRGGGYTSEILLADADAALAALDSPDHGGGICVLGRGLGAYIALQLAGGRAAQVHGAVLCDGPGLAGGPSEPTSQQFFAPPYLDSPPDRHALVELGRDLRPPDYATAFVRLAVTGSPLDEPITVTAAFRPPWLQAVVAEQGVVEATIAAALATYTDGP